MKVTLPCSAGQRIPPIKVRMPETIQAMQIRRLKRSMSYRSGDDREKKIEKRV